MVQRQKSPTLAEKVGGNLIALALLSKKFKKILKLSFRPLSAALSAHHAGRFISKSSRV